METHEESAEKPTDKTDKPGFFGRIRSGLSKTRARISNGLGNLLLGRKEIDQELLDDIETVLLTADVGVTATTEIIGELTEKVARKELTDGDAVLAHLKRHLADLLAAVQQPLEIESSHRPFVILVVGVNGAGKTTTIGKLAAQFQNEGRSVMLAAGDTFRAAAVEQLQVWGERNKVPVVAQQTGSDSASVIFDALSSAKSRQTDVLIADTAGRLHSKSNLMDELAKVHRVMLRIDESAPHEVLLVIDATTGQNAIRQAMEFKSRVEVSGLVLTKLDGTAKGGVIFAIARQLALPIRYIGVGEQIEDLRPFVAEEFVRGLFDE